MSDNHFEWGTAPVRQAPVLVHHMYGAMDAGEAGHLAVSQMLSSLSAQRVATFDTSRYVDYRSRRPIISVENWCLTDIAMPEIAVDLLTDYSGNSFLILHGPEPDFHWDEFSESVMHIAQRYGVESVIGLMGMPAGIPHTRSTFVHQTATDELDIPTQPEMPHEVRITASMGMFVQHWAGQAGLHSIGLVAGIPYYLADAEFPQGGAALIDYLAAMTQLQLPVGDLAAAANQMRNVIDKQISDSEEVMGIVHMIEERYDSSMDQMSTKLPGAPAPIMPEDIPSGEDIASKFQEFFSRVDASRSIFPTDISALGAISATQKASSGDRNGKDAIGATAVHASSKEKNSGEETSQSAQTKHRAASSLHEENGRSVKQKKFESRKNRRGKFTSRKYRRQQRRNDADKDTGQSLGS